MAQTTKDENAGSFYDRQAKIYALTFKLNGYERSLRKYFQQKFANLPENARILDVGCGTGLVSYSFLSAMRKPLSLISFDLSFASLQIARRETEVRRRERQIFAECRNAFLQADMLKMPFADASFDAVLSSGSLEYVPINEGIAEMARVVKPNGLLAILPTRPTLATKILEKFYDFKSLSPENVSAEVRKYFEVLEVHRFNLLEPIGWSKVLILARRK